jgi:hypothetical protein
MRLAVERIPGGEQAFPGDAPSPTLVLPLGTYYTTNNSDPSQAVTYAAPYYGGRAP